MFLVFFSGKNLFVHNHFFVYRFGSNFTSNSFTSKFGFLKKFTHSLNCVSKSNFGVSRENLNHLIALNILNFLSLTFRCIIPVGYEQFLLK